MTKIPSSVGTSSTTLPTGKPLRQNPVEAGGVVGTAPVNPVQTKPPDAESTKVAPSPEHLKKLVGEMQQMMDARSSDLQFSIDQDSGESVIKVIDRTTKDVVLQIPSEEALKIAKQLDQYQQGTLVNRKA